MIYAISIIYPSKVSHSLKGISESALGRNSSVATRLGPCHSPATSSGLIASYRVPPVHLALKSGEMLVRSLLCQVSRDPVSSDLSSGARTPPASVSPIGGGGGDGDWGKSAIGIGSTTSGDCGWRIGSEICNPVYDCCLFPFCRRSRAKNAAADTTVPRRIPPTAPATPAIIELLFEEGDLSGIDVIVSIYQE